MGLLVGYSVTSYRAVQFVGEKDWRAAFFSPPLKSVCPIPFLYCCYTSCHIHIIKGKVKFCQVAKINFKNPLTFLFSSAIIVSESEK